MTGGEASEQGSAGNIPCHLLRTTQPGNKSSSRPAGECSPAPRLQRCFGQSPSGYLNSAEGKPCRGPGLEHPQEPRWGLWTILQEGKSRLCRLAQKQQKIKQNIQLSLERRRSRVSVTFIWAKSAFVSRI